MPPPAPLCFAFRVGALLDGHQDALFVEQLGKLAGLVHGGEDVAAANELAVDVQLRNGRPIGELLDPCPPSPERRPAPSANLSLHFAPRKQ